MTFPPNQPGCETVAAMLEAERIAKDPAVKKKIAVSVDCPEDLTLSHDSKRTSEALFNPPAANFFEMSERCNISPRFSMKFFGRCNISRTFGFYNTLINRLKALKAI